MSEPRGLRGALTWFPAGVCGGEAGPEEESDLKSPSSSLYLPAPNVAGRATGRDARRRALRPARPAPPQEPNAWVSKLPDAVTLLMRHPQPPRPRGCKSWRGNAQVAAQGGVRPEGTGCCASSSSAAPSHPSPREPVGRRRPQAAGRTASPARQLVRAHPERVGAPESGDRGMGGTVKSCWLLLALEGPFGFSALQERAVWFHPG